MIYTPAAPTPHLPVVVTKTLQPPAAAPGPVKFQNPKQNKKKKNAFMIFARGLKFLSSMKHCHLVAWLEAAPVNSDALTVPPLFSSGKKKNN